MTREEKGLAVLEWLEVGPQTARQLMTMAQLNYAGIRQGLGWLRDYDPNCLVSYHEGTTWFYKLAEDGREIRTYVHMRSRTLYRMALRLERMVTIAAERWPKDKRLRVMARHLTRMREDVEEVEETSA